MPISIPVRIVGERAREVDQEEALARVHLQRGREVAMAGLDRADPGLRRDDDREEGEHRRDQRLRRGSEAEPQQQQRDDRHLRQHLEHDDERRVGPREHGELTEDRADREAQAGGEQEAPEDLLQRHPRVLPRRRLASRARRSRRRRTPVAAAGTSTRRPTTRTPSTPAMTTTKVTTPMITDVVRDRISGRRFEQLADVPRRCPGTRSCAARRATAAGRTGPR